MSTTTGLESPDKTPVNVEQQAASVPSSETFNATAKPFVPKRKKDSVNSSAKKPAPVDEPKQEGSAKKEKEADSIEKEKENVSEKQKSTQEEVPLSPMAGEYKPRAKSRYKVKKNPKPSSTSKMKASAPSFVPGTGSLVKAFEKKYNPDYILFVYSFTGEQKKKAIEFLKRPLKAQLELLFYRNVNENPHIDFEAKAKASESKDVLDILDELSEEIPDEQTPYYNVCLALDSETYDSEEQSAEYDYILESWLKGQTARIIITGLDEDIRYADIPKVEVLAPVFEQEFRNKYNIDIRSHYIGTPVDIVFNLFLIEECDSDKVLEHVGTLYDIPRTSEDTHVKALLAEVDKNLRKAEIALANFELDDFEHYEQKISGYRRIIHSKMGLEPRVFVQQNE